MYVCRFNVYLQRGKQLCYIIARQAVETLYTVFAGRGLGKLNLASHRPQLTQHQWLCATPLVFLWKNRQLWRMLSPRSLLLPRPHLRDPQLRASRISSEPYLLQITLASLKHGRLLLTSPVDRPLEGWSLPRLRIRLPGTWLIPCSWYVPYLGYVF